MPASPGDKVQIVYFSGTGGTARVAACLVQAFETRGRAVVSLSLECRRNGDPPPAAIESSANLLVLLYPEAGKARVRCVLRADAGHAGQFDSPHDGASGGSFA